MNEKLALGCPSLGSGCDPSARQIAGGICWLAMRESLSTTLVKEPTGYYRDNACAVLKEKAGL